MVFEFLIVLMRSLFQGRQCGYFDMMMLYVGILTLWVFQLLMFDVGILMFNETQCQTDHMRDLLVFSTSQSWELLLQCGYFDDVGISVFDVGILIFWC